MTGLGSSEMKSVVDSELAVGHLAFKVADLKSSCQFYANLGIPPFAIEEKVAIVELRGGTHLVLLEVDQLAGEGLALVARCGAATFVKQLSTGHAAFVSSTG